MLKSLQIFFSPKRGLEMVSKQLIDAWSHTKQYIATYINVCFTCFLWYPINFSILIISKFFLLNKTEHLPYSHGRLLYPFCWEKDCSLDHISDRIVVSVASRFFYEVESRTKIYQLCFSHGQNHLHQGRLAAWATAGFL